MLVGDGQGITTEPVEVYRGRGLTVRHGDGAGGYLCLILHDGRCLRATSSDERASASGSSQVDVDGLQVNLLAFCPSEPPCLVAPPVAGKVSLLSASRIGDVEDWTGVDDPTTSSTSSDLPDRHENNLKSFLRLRVLPIFVEHTSEMAALMRRCGGFQLL